MTETARADDAGPVASDAIPGIGTLLAGITTAAMFLPVRNGVDDPVVWAGTGLAVTAVLAFLVRRHGLLEPRLSAAVAAGSSVGVVLLAGYALNQGVTTSLLSIPIVFVAFVTAGLTVGVAVADFFGIGVVGLKRRTNQALVMTGVGLVGLILPQLLMILFAAPVYPFIETLPKIERLVATQLVTQLGVVVGTGIVVVAFLRWTDRGLAFIDLRWPTLREVAWTVGGLVVLFGALFAISTLMQSTGVESAEHSTTQRAADNPELMLIMVPIAVLIIGPFEEILYRNVIQKSLYETFSRFGAVAVASVIFAAVHVLAYATAGLGAVVASLGTIFALSIVLGVIYERTDNLLIPALVHGLYNALTFLSLYYTYA